MRKSIVVYELSKTNLFDFICSWLTKYLRLNFYDINIPTFYVIAWTPSVIRVHVKIK